MRRFRDWLRAFLRRRPPLALPISPTFHYVESRLPDGRLLLTPELDDPDGFLDVVASGGAETEDEE